MRTLVRVLAVLAAGAAAAPAHAADRIVGGAPATRGYDYAAALRVSFGGPVARCAGALISARFVVTAAHCLVTESGAEPTRIQVALGNVNYDTASYTDVPLTNFQRHPQFTGTAAGGYDVALIQLPSGVANDQARLLRPADVDRWAAGTTATVIGWGLTEDPAEGGSASSELLEVQVPIYADAACAADFQAAGAPPGFFDAQTMLCAGGRDGRDSCNGDSGGPLLVPDGPRLALAGLVSFGAVQRDGSSCAEGMPGVYTRVAADPLNAFIRQRVPQVEIDVSPAQPQPDHPVTLTALGSTPGAPAYDAFTWDLDDDGAFDDASGPSINRMFPRGSSSVGVRAARGAEAEMRRISFPVRHRSAISFADRVLSVTEGQSVTLTVVKAGSGAGAASLVSQPGSAQATADFGPPSSPDVTFLPDQAWRKVTIGTVADEIDERTETFTVELTGHTGELVPAGPSRITVRIVDPQIATSTRRAKLRRHEFSLRYRTATAGRVVLRVEDARGRRVYGRAVRRHDRGGSFAARVRLNGAGRRAIERRRSLRLRLVLAVYHDEDLLITRRARLKLVR